MKSLRILVSSKRYSRKKIILVSRNMPADETRCFSHNKLYNEIPYHFNVSVDSHFCIISHMRVMWEAGIFTRKNKTQIGG